MGYSLALSRFETYSSSTTKVFFTILYVFLSPQAVLASILQLFAFSSTVRLVQKKFSLKTHFKKIMFKVRHFFITTIVEGILCNHHKQLVDPPPKFQKFQDF